MFSGHLLSSPQVVLVEVVRPVLWLLPQCYWFARSCHRRDLREGWFWRLPLCFWFHSWAYLFSGVSSFQHPFQPDGDVHRGVYSMFSGHLLSSPQVVLVEVVRPVLWLLPQCYWFARSCHRRDLREGWFWRLPLCFWFHSWAYLFSGVSSFQHPFQPDGDAQRSVDCMFSDLSLSSPLVFLVEVDRTVLWFRR